MSFSFWFFNMFSFNRLLSIFSRTLLCLRIPKSWLIFLSFCFEFSCARSCPKVFFICLKVYYNITYLRLANLTNFEFFRKAPFRMKNFDFKKSSKCKRLHFISRNERKKELSHFLEIVSWISFSAFTLPNIWKNVYLNVFVKNLRKFQK